MVLTRRIYTFLRGYVLNQIEAIGVLFSGALFVFLAPFVYSLEFALCTLYNTRKNETERSVFITGASSGIGAALARKLAGDARTVSLYLVGREPERLKLVAEECRRLSGDRSLHVETITLDITQRAQTRDAILRADTSEQERGRKGLTTVIANAGVAISGTRDNGFEAGHEIAEVNVLGTLNTLVPCVNIFVERKYGEIVIVSSASTYVPGSPYFTTYGATKAFGRFYGEALQVGLRGHGVQVHVATPGYVNTPMVEELDVKKIDASECAKTIKEAMDGGWYSSLLVPAYAGLCPHVFEAMPAAFHALIGRLQMRYRAKTFLEHPN